MLTVEDFNNFSDGRIFNPIVDTMDIMDTMNIVDIVDINPTPDGEPKETYANDANDASYDTDIILKELKCGSFYDEKLEEETSIDETYEDFEVQIKPYRLPNVTFADKGCFPSYICSVPYKYILKLSYKNHITDDIYLYLLFDNKNDDIYDDGFICEWLTDEVYDKAHKKNYKIMSISFTSLSFGNKKKSFRLGICDEKDNVIFTSNLFKIVARKNQEEVKFWKRFRTVKKNLRDRKIKFYKFFWARKLKT